jgi:hypothetical protein
MSNRQSRQAFEVFVVEEGRDGKNWWNKVGGGFENNDGSMSLRLHLFPDLLLQVRAYVPRDEREDRGGGRDNQQRRGGRQGGRQGGRRGGRQGGGYRRDDRDDGPPDEDPAGYDDNPTPRAERDPRDDDDIPS